MSSHDEMDDTPNHKRSKKSDKAREKEERNGKFSQKHVRAVEKFATKPKAKKKDN